jgi:predicted nucleotidyltransferase
MIWGRLMKEPQTKQEIMHILKKQLPYLQEKYGVQRIAIYGSFAKGNQTKKVMSISLSNE